MYIIRHVSFKADVLICNDLISTSERISIEKATTRKNVYNSY